MIIWKGFGHALIEILSPEFGWRGSARPRNLYQDSLRPGRNSNRPPPEYFSRALALR
jgi:hypothetical protein